MAVLDLYLHLGNEHINGGPIGNRPSTRQFFPGLTTTQGMGFGLRMEEFGRVEPSDATGSIATSGYEPYWDGVPESFTVVSATANSVTINASLSADEWVGRLISVTVGTGSGSARITANTGNAAYGVADDVTITISGTWTVTPVASDTVQIRGGFCVYHTNPGINAEVYAINPALGALTTHVGQIRYHGDNWYESGDGVLSATATLISRLVDATHGNAGPGFKFFKRAAVGGVSQWIRGQTGQDAIAADLQEMQDFLAANGGHTMLTRAVIVDSSDADIFGANLNYERDVQQMIDSLRDRLEELGLADPPDSFTATSSTTTTVTVTGAGWEDDEWKGRSVRIDSGAEAGEVRLIASNTEDTITLYTSASYGGFAGSPGAADFSILASPLIILVSHKSTMNTAVPVLAPAARYANQLMVSLNVGVRTVDMQAGEFRTAAQGAAVVDPDQRYYDVPTYLDEGYWIHTAIQNYYAGLSAPTSNEPIPCVVLVGTSQIVTAGIPASIYNAAMQPSFGTGSQPMLNGYIWNDVTKAVEPYSAGQNSSTFGELAAYAGPEGSCLRDLIRQEFPSGAVAFKFGKSSMAAVIESIAYGAPYAFEQFIEEEFEDAWVQFKQACVRDLGRSVDCIHIHIDLSENDMFSTALLEPFTAKIVSMITTLRAMLKTRVNGSPIRVTFQHPPPPATDVAAGYGSTLHTASIRREFRDWIKDTLPTLVENLGVIENLDGKYELQESDSVHYGGHAAIEIGFDIAADAIENYSVEGEEPVEPTPETAALVVETGSGLTDANSYCTVEFADSYHLHFGEPAAWDNATTAQKELALRVATQALDSRYWQSWRGTRNSIDQALDWPRYDVEDSDGYYLSTTTVPRAVQTATAYMALRQLEGDTLVSDLAPSAAAPVLSESVTGPAGGTSKTYASPKPRQKQYPIVDGILRHLTHGSGNSYPMWLG